VRAQRKGEEPPLKFICFLLGLRRVGL
jgi:hypothetical protein